MYARDYFYLYTSLYTCWLGAILRLDNILILILLIVIFFSCIMSRCLFWFQN